LITDTRVILNTNVNSYSEERSFFINEIKWIALSTKHKRSLLFCVEDRASLYISVSSKRKDDAIKLIKILYERLMKVGLKVFEVPKTSLHKYVINGEEARTGGIDEPREAYLRQESESEQNSSEK
jgi:hypothetical protein